MPSGNSLKRKLNKKVIRRFGQDAVLKRYDGTTSLNIYGEPDNISTSFTESTLKIVIITDKREVEETLIGGIPQDNNKEFLLFYFSGDDGVQTGDKIIYPVDTENEWIVFMIEPIVFNEVNVISKAKCHRDRRY